MLSAPILILSFDMLSVFMPSVLMLCVVIQSVIMQSAIMQSMLSVIMLSVIMLSVIMLSVIMLSVLLLSVVAPCECSIKEHSIFLLQKHKGEGERKCFKVFLTNFCLKIRNRILDQIWLLN
jgi:hypothetical protein